MRHIPVILIAMVWTVLGYALPASAKIFYETGDGFVIRVGLEVPAHAAETWAMLVDPAQWWDPAATFSGDAANLSLDPRGGGCFCETLPSRQSPDGEPRGSVEHMRVIHAEPPRALRLVGALGPLQGEAAIGVMTMILQPGEAGTRIVWEYVVSGRLRKAGVAATVDAALSSSMLRLGERLGVIASAKPGAGTADTREGDGAASLRLPEGR